MLKMRAFETHQPNFLSTEVKTWALEGQEQGRTFNALWIDRSDEKAMFLSFTKSFMESENEGEKSLFEQYQECGTTEIDLDFNFVFKNNPSEGKGNPPILNLADSYPVDILAFRVITRENEMITNINTGYGVNNYSAWISPEKQELIMVSSFDDNDSYLQIFVQNMDTNMVTKYLIGFNSCHIAIPFPSSRSYKVPEKIIIPTVRHDLSKVSETLVVLIDNDELSTFEKKTIGEKNMTTTSLPDDAPLEDIQKAIQNLAREKRDRKIILVRTTPIVTGIIMKEFHNNVFVLHQYGETGRLFKIV
jgi:hypothetical protein